MRPPLALPRCPHCGTREERKDVRLTARKKTAVCPVCGGQFAVCTRGRLLWYGLCALALIGINVLLLYTMRYVTFWILAAITACGLIGAWVFSPYAVRYRAIPVKAPPRQKNSGMKK
jgi:hypothetical protein